MRSWLWISTNRITARVELKDNIIVFVAPIFKWALGLSKEEFLKRLKEKHPFNHKEFIE